MTSSGASSFRSNYEICPIILAGGIAANVQGGLLPIIQLLQSSAFSTGLTGGGNGISGFLSGGLSSIFGASDENFAHFEPVAGGEAVKNQIATYPFANQAVAANAIIVDGLELSLIMKCPARGAGGWGSKSAIMKSLQASLLQHSALGGWYIVATPALTYPNMLLRSLVDASDGSSRQPQNSWLWNFYQPLLTEAQAQQTQNTLMSKISSGTQILPDANGNVSWSGLSNSQAAPLTGATSTIFPAGGNAATLAGNSSGSPLSGASSFMGPQ